MRNHIILAATILAFTATSAYAGEGNGDPFSGPDAVVSTRIGARPYAAKDQDPYQFRTAGVTTRVDGYKLSSAHDSDPYQMRVAGAVVGSPTSAMASNNQAPTATNVTTQAATPNASPHT